MNKTDGWVLFRVLESFLLLRALGYAGEPWWARWAPCFVFSGLLVVSGEPSDLWSNMVLLLGAASLVAHAIWGGHTFPRRTGQSSMPPEKVRSSRPSPTEARARASHRVNKGHAASENPSPLITRARSTGSEIRDNAVAVHMSRANVRSLPPTVRSVADERTRFTSPFAVRGSGDSACQSIGRTVLRSAG